MGSTQTFARNNFNVTVSSCDETWIYSRCLQYGAIFLLSVIFLNFKVTLISLSYKIGKDWIIVPLIYVFLFMTSHPTVKDLVDHFVASACYLLPY